jgi:hypothetical protein
MYLDFCPRLRRAIEKLFPHNTKILSSIACFFPSFQGIKHLNELFYLFEIIEFLEQFNVIAPRFIFVISVRYGGNLSPCLWEGFVIVQATRD